MYAEPIPDACAPAPAGQRSEHNKSEILAIAEDGELVELLLRENTGQGGQGWHQLPMALTPPAPIPTKAQRRAILEWGKAVADALPGMMGGSSLDLLRRVPPRMLESGELTRDADRPDRHR